MSEEFDGWGILNPPGDESLPAEVAARQEQWLRAEIRSRQARRRALPVAAGLALLLPLGGLLWNATHQPVLYQVTCYDANGKRQKTGEAEGTSELSVFNVCGWAYEPASDDPKSRICEDANGRFEVFALPTDCAEGWQHPQWP